MARIDLLDALSGRFAPLATAVDLPATDTPDGYGPALDDAYDALLVAQTPPFDAVGPGDALWGDLVALGRYGTLRLLAERLALSVDVIVESGAVSKKRSQAFAQVRLLLAEAEAEIARRGYGPQAFQLGRLQLDIFEPGGLGAYGSLHPLGG